MTEANPWAGLRRVQAAWLVALLLGAPALAAERAEPAHIALIIGNTEYPEPKKRGVRLDARNEAAADPDVILMPRLPNACADAQNVGADLQLKANWGAKDVIVRCNLTRGRMIDEISNFVARVRKGRAVGLFYFAGHGMQVGTHNYLFGIKAKPNARDEARALLENPDAPLFPEDAIDLHQDLTKRFGNVTNGALLLVIDACRDNPLLPAMLRILNQPGNDHVTVSAPSTSTKTVPGVVIAYSTSDGATADDGAGGASPYAAAFSAHLTSGKQIGNILSETATAVFHDTQRVRPTDPQNPELVGYFAEPPIWCFSQCPNEEGRARAAQAAPPQPQPTLRLASYQQGPAPPPTTAPPPRRRPTFLIRNEVVPPDKIILASKPGTHFKRGEVPIAIDVYWCMGGPDERTRQTDADHLADLLRRTSFGPATVLTDLRLKSLSIQANSREGYRFESDVIVAGSSKLNSRVADVVRQGRQGLSLNPSRTAIPGLVDVFLCSRDRASRAGDVYVQYPRAQGSVLAKAAARQLMGNRQLNVVDGERGIDPQAPGVSPKNTEVRFYRYSEQAGAFDAAHTMKSLLGHPVVIKYIPRVRRNDTDPLIEVWLGEKEPSTATPI